MSNSKLVNYTKISPFKGNWNGKRYVPARTHAIDTITIHCVVGQLSVETLGNVFSRVGKNASSNYGVGYDGRIGMYVEEKDRSWCSSNGANDNRAVTIEVASDSFHPYAVNQKAWNSMIKLVADICMRNNIKQLKWSTSKADRINHRNGCNMTVHRDYDTKSCPGDFLYSRHGQIAKEVNDILNGQPKPEPTPAKLDVDGLFGEESIKALQKWLNVKFVPDGIISGQVKAQKKYYPNILNCTYDETGSDTVELLQAYLNEKKYNAGDVDGIIGKQTITAWQKFLVNQGYDTGGIDGIFGSASAKAMQMFLNR